MRLVAVPFFLVILLFANLITFFKLGLLKIIKYKTFCISLFLLFLATISLISSWLSPTPTGNHSPQIDKINQEKEIILYWLNLQPQHRDLLYNLSQIELALGEDSSAAAHLEQAIRLDPNHSLFFSLEK